MNVSEYRRWVEDAESELESARILLDGVTQKTITHGIGANIVEHCQQALEKLLKAVFLKKNIRERQPRIHRLSVLLEEAALADIAPKNVRDALESMDKDYKHIRYPNSSVLPYLTDLKQLKEVYRLSKVVFEWITSQG
jgi:HEPN domain-containing protein